MGPSPQDADFNQHSAGRGWPDREIGALASRQRTHVTHAQLIGLGVGRAAIWRAAGRRRLHRVHQGVYSLMQAAARPPLAAEHAAILACGPSAVISHDSAASLWGLREPTAGPLGITVVDASAGYRRPGIDVHRVSGLDRRDIRRRHGLPVTAPARLVLDMTPSLSTRELEQLIDEALFHRLTSRTAIAEMLDRYPRRAGFHVLRFTWHQLEFEPEACLVAIATAFATRITAAP